MNEEKNGLNNQTNNTVEMPALEPRVVKPIPVTPKPVDNTTQTPATVQPAQPNPAPAQPAPAQPVGTATPAQTKEVGTVVVGKPMSNIVKPIPVGEVGTSAPQATIGGTEAPTPKKGNNPVLVVILILAIIGLVGYAVWTYVLKDMFAAKTLEGTISAENLIYSGVKKGDSIVFKSSDKLSLIVDVKDLEVQDNVGTKVTYTVREENGKEILTPSYEWLTDDGKLKIPVSILGETAIFNYRNTDSKNEIAFISADGSITKINDYAGVLKEENGLYIENSASNGFEYEVIVSRVIDGRSRKYGNLTSTIEVTQDQDNEELLEKYTAYNSEDGISICVDDAKKIPEGTTITATIKYSVKDDVLDIKNPSVSEKIDYSKYIKMNGELLCK